MPTAPHGILVVHREIIFKRIKPERQNTESLILVYACLICVAVASKVCLGVGVVLPKCARSENRVILLRRAPNQSLFGALSWQRVDLRHGHGTYGEIWRREPVKQPFFVSKLHVGYARLVPLG